MILNILFKIFVVLVACLACMAAIFIWVDLMFRVGGSSLFEILDEIERLHKENKKYKDDDN